MPQRRTAIADGYGDRFWLSHVNISPLTPRIRRDTTVISVATVTVHATRDDCRYLSESAFRLDRLMRSTCLFMAESLAGAEHPFSLSH
jgi:hypothetical protein